MIMGVQEWEYLVEYWKGGRRSEMIDNFLNKWGKAGWELVALQWWGDGENATAVFKRRKA